MMRMNLPVYPMPRVLLALFFIVGGVLHFVFPDAYIAIMPHWLPWHLQLVFISGVFEIAGGAGILIGRTRLAAGVGLILLSIAVLPANLQMLLNAHTVDAGVWKRVYYFCACRYRPG